MINMINIWKEVKYYRGIEKRLENMFSGKLTLERYVDELERALLEPDSPHPMNARILTYAESTEWDEYLCVKAEFEKKSGKSLNVVRLLQYFIETVFDGKKHEGFSFLTNEDSVIFEEYKNIGTVEECMEALEKQNAKKPRLIVNTMVCPNCPKTYTSPKENYCGNCGQKIDWK